MESTSPPSVELVSQDPAAAGNGADAPLSDRRVQALRLDSVFHGRREAPDEVLSDSTEEEYLAFRSQTDWREPYRIRTEYLAGTKAYVGPIRPDTPLIVFINAKSGGNLGPRLASIFYRCLGQAQVFDVSVCRPATVLKTLYANLAAAEARGEAAASHVRRNLHIMAAGGDGTVTWVLGSIMELGLDPPPPLGVLPLGTGNDLSLTFGWGASFSWNWVKTEELYNTLKRFKDATACNLDRWRVEITAPDASLFQELPHSLQVPQGGTKAGGTFWNYLSVGLDAEAAYGFHSLREAHPALASSRVANQAWYGVYSCSTGWFCGSAPLATKLRLRVRGGRGGEAWRDVVLPSSVRAVVLLNLQSYGGGRDIWGLSNSHSLDAKGFTQPIYDDGLIEVVGLRGGWHTAAVMGQVSSRVHAKRLAQCSEVQLELVATGARVHGETGMTYMQLDGEPWPQAIPAVAGRARAGVPGTGPEPLRVHISHAGQSRLLFNKADTIRPGPFARTCRRCLT